MKPPHSWMSDRNRSHHNFFAQKIVMALYAIVFGLFIIAVFSLCYALGLFKQLRDIVGPVICLSILPAWWFSKITAHYMAYDDQSFGLAVQNTFYPVLVKLTFVPVVGPVAERIMKYRKHVNPFVESTIKTTEK